MPKEPESERRAPEPQPEGGPEARKRECLEERMTRIRSRSAADDAEEMPGTGAPEHMAHAEHEHKAPPKDFRTGLVGRYRDRQKAQLEQQEEGEGAKAEGGPAARTAAAEEPAAE